MFSLLFILKSIERSQNDTKITPPVTQEDVGKITVCRPIACHPKTITPRSRLSLLQKSGIAMFLGLIVTLFSGFAPAYAYSGNSAANWADNNWNSPLNPSVNENCTNFISQALHNGGNFGYVNPQQNASDDHNWWAWQTWYGWIGIWNESNSFVIAPDLYNFLEWHYPGGYNWGNVSGRGTSGKSSGLQTGDVLFYSFTGTQGGGIDHTAIQTSATYDPSSGWHGNTVDAQNTNRYHAYWSLEPYNVQAATTTIILEHIDPSN